MSKNVGIVLLDVVRSIVLEVILDVVDGIRMLVVTQENFRINKEGNLDHNNSIHVFQVDLLVVKVNGVIDEGTLGAEMDSVIAI